MGEEKIQGVIVGGEFGYGFAPMWKSNTSIWENGFTGRFRSFYWTHKIY
jgi:hypothetical protein